MSAHPPSHNVAKSAAIGLAAVFTVGVAIAFVYIGALWLVAIAIMLGLGALVGLAMGRRA